MNIEKLFTAIIITLVTSWPTCLNAQSKADIIISAGEGE